MLFYIIIFVTISDPLLKCFPICSVVLVGTFYVMASNPRHIEWVWNLLWGYFNLLPDCFVFLSSGSNRAQSRHSAWQSGFLFSLFWGIFLISHWHSFDIFPEELQYLKVLLLEILLKLSGWIAVLWILQDFVSSLEKLNRSLRSEITAFCSLNKQPTEKMCVNEWKCAVS